MFQMDEALYQGDTDFWMKEDFLAVFEDQPLASSGSKDFNILDSIIERNDPAELNWESAVMNMDLKEILTDVLSEETMDISSLLTLNDGSSVIPVIEESFNLNSTEQFPLNGIIYKDLQSSQSSDNISSISDKEIHIQEEVNQFDPALSNPVEYERLSSNESEGTERSAGKKYIEMRRKNNIASQRSRKLRKQKNVNMASELKALEKENKELLLLSKKLEIERDALHKQLMSIIAKK